MAPIKHTGEIGPRLSQQRLIPAPVQIIAHEIDHVQVFLHALEIEPFQIV